MRNHLFEFYLRIARHPARDTKPEPSREGEGRTETAGTDALDKTRKWATVDSRVAAIEDKIAKILFGAGPLQPILDYITSSRGKRLRPLLVAWTAEASAAVSGKAPVEDDILCVAAVFELVHMASLVHDDIIDGAGTRRGVPTPHLLWGLHSAVLAGDYLFTRANRVALRYHDFGIASLVNQAIELTCEGEVAQDSRLYDCSVTGKEYLSCICKKTATLFGAACQAGAALAGAPAWVEESMLRFGVELGCAFQITDDVLDLTGEPAVTGKPSCTDLRGGVLTLPLVLAMEGPARPLIAECFRTREFDDAVVQSIRNECASGGCIERARQEARRLAGSALSRLGPLPDSPGKAALESIAAQVAIRDF